MKGGQVPDQNPLNKSTTQMKIQMKLENEGRATATEVNLGHQLLKLSGVPAIKQKKQRMKDQLIVSVSGPGQDLQNVTVIQRINWTIAELMLPGIEIEGDQGRSQLSIVIGEIETPNHGVEGT